MNNNLKNFLVISFISILMMLSLAYATEFTVPQAKVDITVLDDGTCMITEEIIQDIDGPINGTYRTIPLKEGQYITNFSFETPGFNSKCQVTQDEDNVTFKVWLYEDKQMTQRISADRINVIYHYNMTNVVKIHNDTAELQYITWGNLWDSDVKNLKTYIHMPGSYDNVNYYYNPPTYLEKSTINDNTLISEFVNVPANTQIEQRLLLPRQYFKSYDHAVITNLNAKEKIMADENSYLTYVNFVDTYGPMINIFLLLFAVIPSMLIYVIFGREPRVDYHNKYEYDLPSDDSPLFVNYMHVGDVGKFDIEAFSATLLDLIDRGYYKIIHGSEDDTIIKRTGKDSSALKDYEKSILDYFKRHEDDRQEISFKQINSHKRKYAKEYQQYINNWNTLAQKEISDEKEKKLFKNFGSKIFNIFTHLILIIAVILLILHHYEIFTLFNVFVLVIFLALAVILKALPNTWAGRWTKEGRISNLKWNAFKNYITDYSMINEKPPASIQVWGKYLVYATALGCAKTTSDLMKQYFEKIEVDDAYINNNDILLFAYYGGLHNMTRSLDSLNTYTENNNSISSIGSIGGGSGGGGGGIF